MLFRRSIRHLFSLPLSAAAVAVSASSLFAQGRPLFDWSGRVDREVRITMHGRDARTQMNDRSPFPSSRLNVETALPQRDGRVSVRVQDGRGDVDVIQQPSARTGCLTSTAMARGTAVMDIRTAQVVIATTITTVTGAVAMGAMATTAATAMVGTAVVTTRT